MRSSAAALLLALSLGSAHGAQRALDEVPSAMVRAREAVQSIVPPAPLVPEQVSDAAVAHIIRWEITSARHYEERLRWPVWPGGASGITWCVGYDGGHQTPAVIGRDWAKHYAVQRLSTTAGITGQDARAVLSRYRDITTPYSYCEQVFRAVTLPAYHRLAKRTFSNGWDRLPPDAQGSLTATVYNRGASMAGSRRSEMRALRDVCVPAADVACMARQYRSMCRLWRGTVNETGLCNRYEDAARLAEGRAR
ncbi:hypothetical protein [Stenotrophomonas sp. NRRL B-14846]|uniref:hypothetical protein n=1 Tax=Stenotrophomonas sp. NRRL B-14846 TaxID=3162882 RepID=UPI003D2D8575